MRVPVPVGVKVTLTVQDAPAASDEPQVLVCAKLPVVETPVIAAAAVPVLETVTAAPGWSCRPVGSRTSARRRDGQRRRGRPPPPPYTSNSESCAAGQPVLLVNVSRTYRRLPAGRLTVTLLPRRVEGVVRRAEDLRVTSRRPSSPSTVMFCVRVSQLRRQLEHQPVDRLRRAEVDGQRLRERAVGALPVACSRCRRPRCRTRTARSAGRGRRAAGGEVAGGVEAVPDSPVRVAQRVAADAGCPLRVPAAVGGT